MTDKNFDDFFSSGARKLKVDQGLFQIALFEIVEDEKQQTQTPDTDLEKIIIERYAKHLAGKKNGSTSQSTTEEISSQEWDELSDDAKKLVLQIVNQERPNRFQVEAINTALKRVLSLRLRFQGKSIRKIILSFCPKEFTNAISLRRLTNYKFGWN